MSTCMVKKLINIKLEILKITCRLTILLISCKLIGVNQQKKKKNYFNFVLSDDASLLRVAFASIKSSISRCAFLL